MTDTPHSSLLDAYILALDAGDTEAAARVRDLAGDPAKIQSLDGTSFTAPGPPPRPNLQWKGSTHRWINESGEQYDVAPIGHLPNTQDSTFIPLAHADAIHQAAASIVQEATSDPDTGGSPALLGRIKDLALAGIARGYVFLAEPPGRLEKGR